MKTEKQRQLQRLDEINRELQAMLNNPNSAKNRARLAQLQREQAEIRNAANIAAARAEYTPELDRAFGRYEARAHVDELGRRSFGASLISEPGER